VPVSCNPFDGYSPTSVFFYDGPDCGLCPASDPTCIACCGTCCYAYYRVYSKAGCPDAALFIACGEG
jgi:hypothetical protein